MPTGHIALPVPHPQRDQLQAIRRGEVALDDVIAAIQTAETDLEHLRDTATVPAEPDRCRIGTWLHGSHLAYWAQLDPTEFAHQLIQPTLRLQEAGHRDNRQCITRGTSALGRSTVATRHQLLLKINRNNRISACA